MEERLNRVKQQLQQSSYKLTPQREATVRVLIENEKDHLSAEDVYLKVKDKSPEIGLATVYRTLELLAELKVVDKINFGDGVARFDLRKEGAKHFHHHLVCMEWSFGEAASLSECKCKTMLLKENFEFDMH